MFFSCILEYAELVVINIIASYSLYKLNKCYQECFHGYYITCTTMLSGSDGKSKENKTSKVLIDNEVIADIFWNVLPGA